MSNPLVGPPVARLRHPLPWSRGAVRAGDPDEKASLHLWAHVHTSDRAHSPGVHTGPPERGGVETGGSGSAARTTRRRRRKHVHCRVHGKCPRYRGSSPRGRRTDKTPTVSCRKVVEETRRPNLLERGFSRLPRSFHPWTLLSGLWNLGPRPFVRDRRVATKRPHPYVTTKCLHATAAAHHRRHTPTTAVHECDPGRTPRRRGRPVRNDIGRPVDQPQTPSRPRGRASSRDS